MDTSGGKVFVPQSVWPVIYQYDEPSSLVVRARDTESMTAAGKKATDLLSGYLTGDTQDVRYKSEDLLEQAKQLQGCPARPTGSLSGLRAFPCLSAASA